MEPNQIARVMIGKQLADRVDLGQPIDVACVGADMSFAWSFAVRRRKRRRGRQAATRPQAPFTSL